jgi:hypothetical protein
VIELLDLKGGRATLSLLGVTRESECLLAEGYYAPAYLRKNRILTDPEGRKYRLSSGLKPGLYAVGAGLETYALEAPLELPEHH